MSILLITISVFIGLDGIFFVANGHIGYLSILSEKAYLQLRVFNTCINSSFTLSMIILTIACIENSDKVTVINEILIFTQLVIHSFNISFFRIYAWNIRQKLIAKSLQEILNDYPLLDSFDEIVFKCRIEFREIFEKEAERGLRKLMKNNQEFSKRITKP